MNPDAEPVTEEQVQEWYEYWMNEFKKLELTDERLQSFRQAAIDKVNKQPKPWEDE